MDNEENWLSNENLIRKRERSRWLKQWWLWLARYVLGGFGFFFVIYLGIKVTVTWICIVSSIGLLVFSITLLVFDSIELYRREGKNYKPIFATSLIIAISHLAVLIWMCWLKYEENTGMV